MVLSCFSHEEAHVLRSLLGALNMQSRGGFAMNFMQKVTALQMNMRKRPDAKSSISLSEALSFEKLEAEEHESSKKP